MENSLEHVSPQIMAYIACKMDIFWVAQLSLISEKVKSILYSQVVWNGLCNRDFCTQEREVQEQHAKLNDWLLVYQYFHDKRIVITLDISPKRFKLNDCVTIKTTFKNLRRNNTLPKSLDYVLKTTQGSGFCFFGHNCYLGRRYKPDFYCDSPNQNTRIYTIEALVTTALLDTHTQPGLLARLRERRYFLPFGENLAQEFELFSVLTKNVGQSPAGVLRKLEEDGILFVF
eukprot:Phypoly_transcript_13029.p1 GENE.Phypoly_transcript_13029~~Phypoly_transcript_13029.p1  ORF type:complete len:263 (+),score=32.66 Phypoly_transcript_13029:100-789(+)